jgi:hypothetical protein
MVIAFIAFGIAAAPETGISLWAKLGVSSQKRICSGIK